jgi:hypothetical protein|tara:strand:+ start:159 stop:482 length:324 start_codon:yes stop_codon:yes gene_type:complete
MARISNYAQDGTVSAADKVLGTDSATGDTKNYTVSSISAFVGSNQRYVHDQNSPSAVWTIQHNLGKFPSVVLVDSEDDVVYGEVNYESNNTIIVTLSAAISGKAFLN